jgi:hypothetical protein
MARTLIAAHQRRAMRRAVRVDCQIVRERDFKLLGSRAVDLSAHGMLVVGQQPVLTGEPVLVAFRLPRSQVWFDAEATVARVVHGRRPGDLGRCFGVAFESIERDVETFLTYALRYVPPPLPLREPRIDYAATARAAACS